MSNTVRPKAVPLLVALVLLGPTHPGTASTPSVAMPQDFVKTNGEFVTIGQIMVKTNSPLNTEEFKQYKWRSDQLWQIRNSRDADRLDKFAAGAWALIKDFPQRSEGYQDIMALMTDYDASGESDKARKVAAELLASSAPQKYKLWTKGFLTRVDSRGRPIAIQFTAVDGRNVDLAALRGKVVLVDFWATTCGPCLAELPRVKAAYEKYHHQGFEIIGVSCDTDQNKLEAYLKQKDMTWPQYFDGKQQTSNKLAVEFGINGIPHMFLVDKKGVLRYDNVRAESAGAKEGGRSTFIEKISGLLSES